MHKILSYKKIAFSTMLVTWSYVCTSAETPATPAPQNSAAHLTHQAHVNQFNSLAPLIGHLASQPGASANMTQAHHTLSNGEQHLSIIEILHILSELVEGINSLVQPDSDMHNALVVPALNNIQELSNKLRTLSTKHVSTDLKAVCKTLDAYIVLVHKFVKHID